MPEAGNCPWVAVLPSVMVSLSHTTSTLLPRSGPQSRILVHMMVHSLYFGAHIVSS